MLRSPLIHPRWRRLGAYAAGAMMLLLAGDPIHADEQELGLPDVDVRLAMPRAAPPDGDQLELIQQLAASGVTVRWDDLFGIPGTIVRHGGVLTEASPLAPDVIARDFLAGLEELFRIADAAPPIITVNGNQGGPIVLSRVWNTQHNGASHVVFEQRIAGTRVFGAVLNFTLDADGRIAMAGAHYSRNGVPLLPPAIATPEAAALAAAEILEIQPFGVVGPFTEVDGVHRAENVFVPPTRARLVPLTAELVIFPMPFGELNRFGWRIEIEVGFDAVYEMVVDAVDGSLLYRRNAMQASEPMGFVFRVQNPTLGEQEFTSFIGINGSWVTTDTTTGNNAIAFHDPAGDGLMGHQPVAQDQHFLFTYTDAIGSSEGADVLTDRDAVVAQAFYYVNALHDRYYRLGFDEASGNFQQDNFGRGGQEGDPILVVVDFGFDLPICCNASMYTPSDGASPHLRLRVGLQPQNLNMHRAMNGDTVAHEWAHGLSNRLVGGGTLGSGAQTRALGEGWSDAFATSLWDDPVYGEYNNGNAETGIRGVAYDASPLTYADLCSPGCQEHRDGRIWATVMWDMRATLRTQYGAEEGTLQHEQLMIDGMKNTPTQPSFLDARDGILAADVVNNGGGNQCLLWAVFAARGMGVSAESAGNTSDSVPADDLPDDCMPMCPRPEHQVRSQGYWSQQFGAGEDAGESTLLCYLAVVGFMSQVFHAERDASSRGAALEILDTRRNDGSMLALLDVQLLTAWLNFASGAIGEDELVPTRRNRRPDTVFSDALATAEAVRLAPDATRRQLEAQKDILEAINLRDER